MTSLPDTLAHPTSRPAARVIALGVVTLALAAALAFAVPPAPATAATHGAGIADITPDGGFLGNFIAPDGTRGYCIDSTRPWPAGPTSGPVPVDSLLTTWGVPLPPETVQKLNYALLTHGDTADPVRAAAVAAFVNAYTSDRARELGPGYAAGSYYIDGHPDVLAAFDAIWSDVESHALPQPSATVAIDMADGTVGTVRVSVSPADVTGSLALKGAVVAESGQSSAEVTDGSVIPIRGIPADDRGEYTVAASANFTMATPAAASLLLYETGDQQRIIRGSTPGSHEFAAAAETAALPLQFSPVIATAVRSADLSLGDAFIDGLTVSVADGSRPWRQRLDGSPLGVAAHGVLYGPFAAEPARSPLPPEGAPVADEHSLVLTGPGEYATEPTTIADAPGYYTWVWTIDAAAQDPAVAASLPAGYRFTSDFGIAEETHLVATPVRPAPQLARTAVPSGGTALAALLLLMLGSGLGIVSRVAR